MSFGKRPVEEISTSDDDCVFLYEVNSAATEAPQDQTAQAPAVELTETVKKRRLELENFLQFLDNSIPSQLLPSKPSEYLIDQANRRLAQAKGNNIEVKDIQLGMDCLPIWEGFYWDPEEESLHSHIQNRLVSNDVSDEICSFLRDQVISKGKKKFEEAQQLGISIDDIWIGHDLLPRWDTQEEPTQESIQEESNPRSFGDSPDTEATVTTVTPDTTQPEYFDSGSSVEEFICPAARRPGAATDAMPPRAPREIFDSSSNSGTDDEDFDDVISLDNFVSEEAYYEELDNIVHNAEIVGAPPGFDMVDLEVYVADADDPDVANLPEMEFAVDRAGFELYYGTEDAIDIEMPGVEIRCSADLGMSEADEAVSNNYLTTTTAEQQKSMRATPNNEQTDFMESNMLQYDADSNVSEEVTSEEDADPGANIVETEDGFAW